METPNTRYRRKREDDTIGINNGMPRSGSASGSQDNDRVIWVHDQRLKRAVQMASEHAPPTPTQKPRSICSSRPSDSSRPRKRPCRQSRSAPTPLSSAGGGSSAPSGDVGLELLLQRFELFNEASNGVGSGSGTSTNTPGKGKGRDMGIDRVSSPTTRSTTTARANQTLVTENQNERNTVFNKDTLPSMKQQIAPSPLSNRTNIIPTNTNTNTATNQKTTKPTQPRTHAGKPKPFKTPFLNPPPTRSSPRRTIPPSPLRALPIQTPTRPNSRSHNANVDIGEDEGNDSFDSFDGMFQDGGPEVEELFRTVDGSRARA